MVRIWLALAVMSASSPCRADCEQQLATLEPAIPGIADSDQRLRAEHHVARARREIAEGDEFDCQVAVDALAKILAKK